MRIILAMMLLGAALAGEAKPIYVDFKLTQFLPDGADRPSTLVGTWSFDDALVKPGAVFEDARRGRRLDSFSFSWLGRRWNPSNARLARLEFDADGELRSWIIGGRAVSGGCGDISALDCVGVPSRVTDFYLAATRSEPGIPPPELVAVGVIKGTDTYVDAHGSFAVRPTEVPAPGSLPLLGSALLVVGMLGRARSRQRGR